MTENMYYWDIHLKVRYVKFYNPEQVFVDEYVRTSVRLEHWLAALSYGLAHISYRQQHDNLIDMMYIVGMVPYDEKAHVTIGEKQVTLPKEIDPGFYQHANQTPIDYEFFNGPTIEVSTRP